MVRTVRRGRTVRWIGSDRQTGEAPGFAPCDRDCERRDVSHNGSATLFGKRGPLQETDA